MPIRWAFCIIAKRYKTITFHSHPYFHFTFKHLKSFAQNVHVILVKKCFKVIKLSVCIGYKASSHNQMCLMSSFGTVHISYHFCKNSIFIQNIAKVIFLVRMSIIVSTNIHAYSFGIKNYFPLVFPRWILKLSIRFGKLTVIC